jgi:hypothetical protein
MRTIAFIAGELHFPSLFEDWSNIHFLFVNRNLSICIFGPRNFQFPSSARTCTSHLEYRSLSDRVQKSTIKSVKEESNLASRWWSNRLKLLFAVVYKDKIANKI